VRHEPAGAAEPLSYWSYLRSLRLPRGADGPGEHGPANRRCRSGCRHRSSADPAPPPHEQVPPRSTAPAPPGRVSRLPVSARSPSRPPRCLAAAWRLPALPLAARGGLTAPAAGCSCVSPKAPGLSAWCYVTRLRPAAALWPGFPPRPGQAAPKPVPLVGVRGHFSRSRRSSPLVRSPNAPSSSIVARRPAPTCRTASVLAPPRLAAQIRNSAHCLRRRARPG